MTDTEAITEFTVIEEIAEEQQAMVEEGEAGENDTFASALEGYYGNLQDDLHDSRGDFEYQRGVLERMTACENLVTNLTGFELMSDEDKAKETEWQ